MTNLYKVDDFDELGMYFGEDFNITDKIIIHQPTIGEIVEFGEREYYSMVHTLTCIPSDMKSQLDDYGINYMDISDFSLFIMLTQGMTCDRTKLILGDLDLSKFKTVADNNSEDENELNTDEIYLYDFENDIKIDKFVYLKIVTFLRKLHGIVPKVEKAANETTRKILIDMDRSKIEKAEKEPYKSQLKELISAMMRYPGFKYKSRELKECGLYEFMDTVQGSQIYVSTTALLNGMYSGMVDTSKINKKEFNWLRNPDKD